MFVFSTFSHPFHIKPSHCYFFIAAKQSFQIQKFFKAWPLYFLSPWLEDVRQQLYEDVRRQLLLHLGTAQGLRQIEPLAGTWEGKHLICLDMTWEGKRLLRSLT